MELRLSHRALIIAGVLASAGCSGGPSGSSHVPTLPGADAASQWRSASPSEPSKYAFTKYAIPTVNSYANRIIAGPDGALWFTEEGFEASKVGRVTTGGTFSEYQLSAGSEPSHLASAFGNVWFTELGGSEFGYIAPSSGQITYYQAQSTTRGIIPGPGSHSRVWFAQYDANSIGIFDATTKVLTALSVPTQAAGPYDLADAASSPTEVWLSEYTGSKIARLTKFGKFTEYPTPSTPQALTLGPDGNIWFAETVTSKIAKMTTSGTVTEYATPTANSGPVCITVGPDGALWFTEYNASKIGRITTAGAITEASTPDAAAEPVGITTGPDKKLWFVEHAANNVVKFAP